MKVSLITHQNCWIYEDCLKDGIYAGFTKPHIQSIDQMSFVLAELKIKAGIAYMHQIHSEIIHRTCKAGCLTGDGIVSDSSGLMLVVKTADCMPILLYEKKGPGIAAVHMGWKSAEKGILGNLPENLSGYRLIAGPSLLPCCYEVGKEFNNYPSFKECLAPRLNGTTDKAVSGDEKLTFDPVLFIKKSLYPRGVREENFFEAEICTLCNTLRLPSYRRTKGRERIFNFIIRNNEERK